MNDKLSTWWRRVRIIRDNYCGYEVQVWYIFWPFWMCAGFSNTHMSLDSARYWARNQFGKPIEYL